MRASGTRRGFACAPRSHEPEQLHADIGAEYLFAILACALAGLASSPSLAQPGSTNNLLTAAGFVVKYPDTPEKQEIYNSLPPNRLVKRRNNGKLYYIYSDPGGCGCAYVGSPNAYANYRNGGFRDRDSNDRVVSEMMREMDQDDSPAQPGSPNGLDYIFGGADF